MKKDKPISRSRKRRPHPWRQLTCLLSTSVILILSVLAGCGPSPEDLEHGHGEIRVTARDMAKFGLLYLDDGEYEGKQVVPADWVRESPQTYSADAWPIAVGRNFGDIGYGYQWWSASAGTHHLNLAWRHGGQLIFLVDELDMVVVVSADPLYGQVGDQAWAHEKANINVMSDFISSLPSE